MDLLQSRRVRLSGKFASTEPLTNESSSADAQKRRWLTRTIVQRRKNVAGKNAAGVKSEFSLPTLIWRRFPRNRSNFRIRNAKPNLYIGAQLP